MKIDVISANYGNKDPELNHQYPPKIFKDEYQLFKDPRRNSRIHKILAHEYSDADFIIWIDGNIKLLKSPEEIVAMMGDYDMMVFKHALRDCIYDECGEVARLKLDDPELIIAQAVEYEKREYGRHKGLGECGFIVRRNNDKVKRFNECWWAEYCRWCRRDQISFMYAINEIGVRVKFVPEYYQAQPDGTVTRGGTTQIVPHDNFSGNFNDPNPKNYGKDTI